MGSGPLSIERFQGQPGPLGQRAHTGMVQVDRLPRPGELLRSQALEIVPWRGTRHSLPLTPEFWVVGFAQTITHEVEPEDGDSDGQPGRKGDPRSISQKISLVADHRAPARRRRLSTQANKGESAYCPGCAGDTQGGGNDHL